MKYVFGLNYMYPYKLLVVKTTTEGGRYWVPLQTVETQQFISNHPRVGFVASVGIRTMSHISSLVIFLIIPAFQHRNAAEGRISVRLESQAYTLDV